MTRRPESLAERAVMAMLRDDAPHEFGMRFADIAPPAALVDGKAMLRWAIQSYRDAYSVAMSDDALPEDDDRCGWAMDDLAYLAAELLDVPPDLRAAAAALCNEKQRAEIAIRAVGVSAVWRMELARTAGARGILRVAIEAPGHSRPDRYYGRVQGDPTGLSPDDRMALCFAVNPYVRAWHLEQVPYLTSAERVYLLHDASPAQLLLAAETMTSLPLEVRLDLLQRAGSGPCRAVAEFTDLPFAERLLLAGRLTKSERAWAADCAVGLSADERAAIRRAGGAR